MTDVCPRHRRRVAGFTLLELSIVIVIFSTVAVMGLQAANMLLARRSYVVTQERLALLDEAMMKFYRVYRRLPCPADRTLAVTNTSYGLEGNCAAGGTLVSGMVPFRALNLPQAMVMDGYTNRINYVVTRLLAVNSTNYDPTPGGIEVRSGSLQQPCSTVCSVLADPAVGTGAAYLLFSNGEDSRGAIGRMGTNKTACYSSTGDTRIDAQNCSPGALTVGIAATVYYDSRFNNGTTSTNYFDDLVLWRQKGRML